MIDARGLSCPEPVMLLRNAMQAHWDHYTLLVDNHAAKENTTRYAEHQGYTVQTTKEGETYTLNISRRA